MSSLDSNASRGGPLIVVSAVLMAVMTIVVGLRILVRTRKNLEIRAEDWLIIPAYIFACTVCIMSIASVTEMGVGRHMGVVQTEYANAAGNLWRFTFTHHILSYSGALVFGKISILVFYRRVFAHLPYVRAVSWTTSALVIALGLAVFLSPFVICRPMNLLFEGNSAEGSCIGWQWYLTYISIPNMFTDLVLIVVPFPVIWSLSMSLGQKLGLTFAFTLGSLDIFASTLRFYEVFIWARGLDNDISWNAVEPALWNTVECSSLVIAACIPHLRPLIQFIVPRTPPRERFHEVTRPAKGLIAGFRKLLNRLRPDDDTMAWWRSKRLNARSLVVRGFETWEELPSGGDDEKAKKEHETGKKRTARWVQDLEGGLEKPRILPPDGIIMVEEVVIVSESAPRSRHDGVE